MEDANGGRNLPKLKVEELLSSISPSNDVATKSFLSLLKSLESIQSLNNVALVRLAFSRLKPEDAQRMLSLTQTLIETLCGSLTKLQEKVTELHFTSITLQNNQVAQTSATASSSNSADISSYAKADSSSSSYVPKLIHVRDKKNGADLVNPEGSSFEDKTSTVLKAKKYKSNWNFHGRKSNNKAELKKYWLSVMTGDVILKAVDGDDGGRILNVYIMHGPFMAEYLTRKAVLQSDGNSNIINIGSVRCPKCKEYHRMVELRKWADYCRSKSVDSIDWEKSWSKINPTRVGSKCE